MEKLNVAIADDNEKMVEVLSKIIDQDEDLKLVGKAHNGEEICNIIKEKQPDVVVLDIIMPKVDGLSVMERFSHDENLKKVPLSLAFAYGSQKSAAILAVLRAGYVNHLITDEATILKMLDLDGDRSFFTS